jgi:hypothetical protein
VATVCGAGEAQRDSRDASRVERERGVGDPSGEAHTGLSRVREAESKGWWAGQKRILRESCRW